MKALVFDRTLELKDVPIPERKPGEALIRVHLSGICNTDIEITKGYMGFSGIPGHEFVGRVEKSDDPGLIGRRVVGEINTGCGRCRWCRRGLERHCPDRTVLGIVRRNGAFAEFLVLPDRNLLPVPDELSDDLAVFTEPLAAAVEIGEQIHLDPSASICVIGDGKLGILAAWTLGLFCPDLTVLGRHPERAPLLVEKGLRWTRSLKDRKATFDIVVESSGSPAAWDLAVGLTRPRGTIVLKSTVAAGRETNLSPLVVNEITVVGSRCGLFQPALNLLEKGLVDPSPLIDSRYDLADYAAAFDRARSHTLKVLLGMPQ
ncbi:MAG: alcohol dehydrogenase catalytic domain-containing protein [PVC group bacterium]